MKPTSFLALAALAAALPALAQSRAATPARVLTPLESAVVDGLSTEVPVDLNLRPSAAVLVSVPTKNGGAPVQKVQRSNLGVDAALYAGLPASNPAPPLLPAAQVAPYLLPFATTGDAAQAWVAMTAQGVPHLYVTGFGEFRADATAAWTSRFTLGGSTSKEVVLRFMVPPSTVSGNTEQDAPALWRARVRADVLVNGFPAWSSEALRLRAPVVPAGGGAAQEMAVLQSFGDPLAFPTNDEDGDPANDSNAGNVSQPAAAKVVYLSLGRFNPGQSIELQMIVRGSAFTQPATAGGTDHRCRANPAGGWFCSRATMSVQMGNMAPQVTLAP